MANVKITQLPLATTPLTGTEVFPLVQGTTTKQVSITGLFTDPTMTNPRLGVVGQADLINATGLPIASGVAGLGTGVATFLGTPSSSNLRAAVTDETGTGSLVFATNPVLVTPNLGTPTYLVATNATGTAVGLIAGSAITNANLTGAVTSVGNATALGSFTSAQLLTALTDETGSGANVFATSPTLVTPVLGTPQSGNFSTGTFTWPTFNQNTTGTAAGLSATLAIASGGTGQITANAAFNALAPSQTGNSGKYLTTDGTNTSWATNPLGTVTSVAATVPSFLSIAGSPITTSGTLAFSLSGTALPTTSGGTGLTSFTSGGVVYASSSSALATGSALVFDGTNLTSGGYKFNYNTSLYSTDATISNYSASNNVYLNGNASGGLRVAGDGSGATNIVLNGASNATPNIISFQVNNAEAMRLTSTGLGIGTSSPVGKLDVRSTNGVIGTINTSTATVNNTAQITLGPASAFSSAWATGPAVKGLLENTSSFATSITINPYNGSTGQFEAARFDPSGNLGLGVTPSAWNTGYKAFVAGGTNSNNQVGGIASGSGITIVSTNYYRSSTPDEIYAGTGYAMKYLQISGQHQWYTAASGTAGNAITFTQAMTLNSSGSFMLGGTSAYGTSRVTLIPASNPTTSSDAANQISIGESSANSAYKLLVGYVNISGGYYGSLQAIAGGVAGPLLLNADGGNVGIGTSNPGSKLQISFGDAAGNYVNFIGDGATAGTALATNWNTGNSYFDIRLGGTSSAYTKARIDSSGNLLVGTTTSASFRVVASFLSSSGNGGIKLIDSQSNNTAAFINFSNGSGTLGSITNNGNGAVLYNVTSDQRLKENIADAESASSLIDTLQVRKFDWKANGTHQRYGFIAQELFTVVPEAVYKPNNENEMMAVDYSKLVPMLVKEIQSLRQRLSAANL